MSRKIRKVNRIVLLLLSLAAISSASAQFEQLDGLYFEVPGKNNTDQNFFNRDNKIYTAGKEFVYSYRLYRDRQSTLVTVLQKNDPQTKSWRFTNSNIDSLTIQHLRFTVLDGYGGMDHLFPDYSQTIIQQKYTAVNGQVLFDGSTGLIENEKNIWLHPFRGKYFSVTEFSPFPYVKLPLKEGTKWTWRLPEIDSRWSDPRIIEYKGTVEATYNYKIVDEKNLKTAFGVLSCFVIDAEAENRIGKSKLRSYFNPQYGFVLLEYTNIDKSKLILELVQINQTKK